MDTRTQIAKIILANFNPPDRLHGSWWLNPNLIADKIMEDLFIPNEELFFDAD